MFKNKKKATSKPDPDANEFGHAPLPILHVPEKKSPSSAASSSGYPIKSNRKQLGERLPMKLEFAHEKFTKLASNKELPGWAHESRKIVAMKQHRRENLHDIKLGMGEFLYRELQDNAKVVQGMYESRFLIESRPLGVIGLSNDDCFVRSISGDAEIVEPTTQHHQHHLLQRINNRHLEPGNDCWRVTDEDDDAEEEMINNNNMKHNNIIEASKAASTNPQQLQHSTLNSLMMTTTSLDGILRNNNNKSNSLLTSSSLAKTQTTTTTATTTTTTDFKHYQPELINTPSGLDIAPLPTEGKKKAVFVLKLIVTAGTPPDAVIMGIRQRVQGARHRSNFARDEFVPCDVRFEANSNGYLCGTHLSSMEVHCRVRTWTAAHHCLVPDEEAKKSKSHQNAKSKSTSTSMNIFNFIGTNAGRFSIIGCWTLDEWKKLNLIKQPSLTEYNLLIRGTADVVSMKSLLEPLKKVRDNGFINYGSQYYFGMSIENSVAFARAFLEGRYTTCFIHHFMCLGRSSRECTDAVYSLKRRLQTVYSSEQGVAVWTSAVSSNTSSLSSSSSSDIRNNNNSALRRNLKFEWKTFIASLEPAIEAQKHVSSTMKSCAADVDFAPLHKLLEIAKHIEQLDGDCTSAMVEHCVIPDCVIQWHLRSLSDLHFNALASIRVKRYGAHRVVPGDVVVVDDAGNNVEGAVDDATRQNKRINHDDRYFAETLDLQQVPNFYLPCSNSLTFDRSIESGLTKYLLSSASPLSKREEEESGLVTDSPTNNNNNNNNNNIEESARKPIRFKVIESEAEAKEFKPTSVVLPKWGIVPEELRRVAFETHSSSTPRKLGATDDNSHLHHLHFDWIQEQDHCHLYPLAPLPTAGGIDLESCAKISKALNIPSSSSRASSASSSSSIISELYQKLLPQITYRPLLMKPRWLFAHCWDNRSVTSSSNFGLDARYSKNPHLHLFPTDTDTEGWRRMLTLGANACEIQSTNDSSSTNNSGFGNQTSLSPASSSAITTTYQTSAEKMSPEAVIVPGKIRPAIRAREVRELMVATIPKNAITTALRIALPTGVALSAALREVFQISVFDNREVSGALDDAFKCLHRNRRTVQSVREKDGIKKIFKQKSKTSIEF